MLRRLFTGTPQQQAATGTEHLNNFTDLIPEQPPKAVLAPAAQARPVGQYYPTRPQHRPIPWYGVLAILAISVLGVSALGLFAYQTWEFVNWLFPNEGWLAKVLAVVNFDVFSAVWISLELFVNLRHGSKVACIIAGGLDFILSLACTVIELSLQAATQMSNGQAPGTSTNLITAGYVVVIIALVVNIICVWQLFRIQWPYISGQAYDQTHSDGYSQHLVYSPAPQPVYSPGNAGQLDANTVLLALQLAGSLQQGQLPLAAGSLDNTMAPSSRAPRARRSPANQEGVTEGITRTQK